MLQTNIKPEASVVTVVSKLAAAYSRADEYIIANAPQHLKTNRTRMIDLGVVSLMEFEDEVFSWDYLRMIFIERLGMYEHGALPWCIDIDRSTDKVLTVRHENGQQLQFEIGQLLLAALKTVH